MLDDVLSPIYMWISGPYKKIALMFIALFVVINGLELALSFLSSYLTPEGRVKRRVEKMYDDIGDYL